MNSGRISIHSPHTGRDIPFFYFFSNFFGDFNPLSPHGERLLLYSCQTRAKKFQSTLPTRGETLLPGPFSALLPYFNPLSPHGERRNAAGDVRGRSDFNPLSPHGERHARFSPFDALPDISIHSPHTGRDSICSGVCFRGQFQSTLPTRGETVWPLTSTPFKISFQSTLPTRGETRTRPVPL